MSTYSQSARYAFGVAVFSQNILFSTVSLAQANGGAQTLPAAAPVSTGAVAPQAPQINQNAVSVPQKKAAPGQAAAGKSKKSGALTGTINNKDLKGTLINTSGTNSTLTNQGAQPTGPSQPMNPSQTATGTGVPTGPSQPMVPQSGIPGVGTTSPLPPGAVPPAAAAPAAAQSLPPMIQAPSGYYPSTGSSGSSRETRTCYGQDKAVCSCKSMKDIKGALENVKQFVTSCTSNISEKYKSGSSELLAINDYRGKVGCMYIVDIEGNCKEATTSDYGQGSGSPPTPGCRDGSHMTPAGFHVTGKHFGQERYDDSNSLIMIGLQGQSSHNRGILVHQGRCGGGAATWGCAGVGDYKLVRKLLGYGSLVYNYFGDQSGNCSGARRMTNCQLDRSIQSPAAAPRTVRTEK